MNPLPLHSGQVIVSDFSATLVPLFWYSENTIFTRQGQENFHLQHFKAAHALPLTIFFLPFRNSLPKVIDFSASVCEDWRTPPVSVQDS